MATKIVTKNSSTASAVPTASDLVQGELAVNVADKRLFTEDNAGAIVELGTNPTTLTVTGEITANGGIALGDNDKATFGASDDLQIYHDGSDSYIKDEGTGNLYLTTNGSTMNLQAGSDNMVKIYKDAQVEIFHDASVKLATTSTGIDVTGTATMDAATVQTASNEEDALLIKQSDGTDVGSLRINNGAFLLKGKSASQPVQIQSHDGNEDIEIDPDGFIKMETAGSERLRINANGSVGIGVADGDVTNDGTSARTYVGIIGTGNRGRLNIGSTASNGADAGALAFTNGANTLADISVDTTAGVQNTGTMYVNGTRSIKIQAAASDEVIFNESGADVDFRVESDSNANMLLVNGGNNSVSIGTSTSEATFTVGGSATFNADSADADFRVESDTNANMLFVDGGANRVIVGAASGLTSTFNVSGNAQFSNGTGNVGSLSISPSNDRQLITANSPGNYGDYGVTLKSMRATGGSTYINNIDMTYQGTVLNEEGLDLDFRVESSTISQALNVDGATGSVGFGTNATTNYGQTAGTGTLAFKADDGSAGGSLMVSNNADRGWSPIYLNKFAWNSGDDSRLMQFYINAGDDTATLEYDGTNFAIVNPSDYRLKENVVSYTGGLAKINAIGVKSFNKIDGVSSHITQEGFIAHELKAVIPLAVIGEKNAMKTNESGEVVPDYQRVNKETLIPYLVSAIQELSAKVETLESRIAALES